MGKSSSSHKNKSSKLSSQDRTRKKSKSKSKSKSRKSRKYRSKKLRHRDDSVSCSDDGDSRSLESVSSFTSEDDDSRSRRARSRTRKHLKGSKKRGRRRSYSPDSSEDSLRGKKRKATKKKNDYEGRKKTRSKMKPRRNASMRSKSSTSFSCSTCRSGSISGDEIESKRHRGRPVKRDRDERDINKVESGTKRARYRSRSSSRSQCSDSGDCQSGEKVTYENNTRRLRSVITITEEYKHGRWMDKDGHKEEITYDDDYPSCRSNDSNDGGFKRELDNHSHVAFEKRMGVDSGKEEGDGIVITDSGNILQKDCGGHDVRVAITGPVNDNKNEVSGAISGLPCEDLESILRQKALENLKRFKGRHQRTPVITTNQEDKSDRNLKQSSTAKAELVQMESPKESSDRVVDAKSSKEDVAEMADATQLVEEANGPPVRDSILSSQNLEKEPDRTKGSSELISAKQDVACPTYQVAVGNSNKKFKTTAVLNKPNLTSPTSRFHSQKPHSTQKLACALQEPPPIRSLVTESSVDKSASGSAQTVAGSSNSKGEDINRGGNSAAPEPSGENVSDEQQGEAKDGSQFEQKTMSVMRGNEMVQVSYKVYIPKKAPALARRQLKR